MTTNVPCPIWIDQLIDRRINTLIESLDSVPEHARQYIHGEIHGLSRLLSSIRMTNVASEK
jgi:hypothetical protein